METSILKTKFNFPVIIQDFIIKPSLIDKLNQGLNKKLVLISALPGSGKTTSMGYWANLYKQTTAWVCLNETDNSLESFISVIIYAFQRIEFGIASDILSIIQKTERSNFDYILTLLINELNDKKISFNLVLDDFHLIKAQNVIQAINFFIKNVPRNIHVYISSRNDILLDCIPKLRLESDIIEIFQNELNFESKDILKFFESNKFFINYKQACLLKDTSSGWILPIKIAIIALNKSNTLKDEYISDKKIEHLLANFSDREDLIQKYFHEIIDGSDNEKKEFLLKTSLFSKFDKEICDFIMNKDTQYLVNWLKNNNLLLVSFNNETEFFSYHHLFSDYLKIYLLNNHQELFIDTHKKVSIWYKEKEMFKESLYYAYNSTDETFFSSIFSNLAINIISIGKKSILKEFLEKLSQETINNNFYFSVYYACITMDDYRTEYASILLENAEKLFKISTYVSKNSDRSLIYFCYTLMYAKRGDPHLASKYAKKLLENKDITNSFLLGEAYFFLGYSYFLCNNTKKAISELSKAISFHKLSGNIAVYLKSLSFIGRCFFHDGDLIQAKSLYEKAIGEYKKNTLERCISLLSVYTDLALINFTLNNRKETNNYLTLASAYKNDFSAVPIYYYLGYIITKIAFREFKEAEKAIHKAKEIAIERSMQEWFSVVIALEHTLNIFKGELYLVQDWANETEKKIYERIGSVREINRNEASFMYLEIYPLILYYLENKNYFVGLKLLNIFYKIISQNKDGIISLKILILQSIFLSKTGNIEESKVILKQVLLESEKQNSIGLFVNELDIIELKKIITKICEDKNTKKELDFAKKVLKSLNSSNTIKVYKNPLSKREQEILTRLKTDISSVDLAKELELSINTLKTHLKRVYKKLNAKNRVEAISKAIQNKYISE